MPSKHRYMTVISSGPFIIVRTPMRMVASKRETTHRWKDTFKWKDMLKALTPVMHSHGMKQKDIYNLDGLSHPADWDPLVDDIWRSEHRRVESLHKAEKLDAAFNGDAGLFKDFWLYDYVDGAFALVRSPVKT